MKLPRLSSTSILIALASFLSATTVRAQLPAPPPRSQNAQQPQQSSAPVNADAPPPVPSHDQPATSDIERRENNEHDPIVVAPVTTTKSLADYLLIVFTIVFSGALVIVGFLQMLLVKKQNEITSRYVRLTDQMVKAAAQSARAAELALNIERPVLFVEGEYMRREMPVALTGIPVKEDRIELAVKFHLKNRGKGVAMRFTANVRLVGIPEGGFRQKRRLTKEGIIDFGIYRARFDDRTINPDELTDAAFVETFSLSREQWQNVSKLELGLLVVIHVKYVDVFKRRFTARFIFDYDSVGQESEQGYLRATHEEYTRYN